MPIRADKLKNLREEKRWSIRYLSKLSGVAKSQISDLETGQKKNVTIDTLCKLVKALDAKVEDLFYCE